MCSSAKILLGQIDYSSDPADIANKTKPPSIFSIDNGHMYHYVHVHALEAYTEYT